MDFETVLPRLVATYESGRLVPFIGAGMSRPACTDWPGLVRKLELEAGMKGAPPLADNAPSDEIVRRGNVAVRALKAGKEGAFGEAMGRAVLDRGGKEPPIQTRALARVSWPLVLTTNYDNYYAAAFLERFPDRLFAVAGRNATDCQRVLSSLTTAGRSLLWALQGYLEQPCVVSPTGRAVAALLDELVVGHDEYRRVTYRDIQFRRAFAEVFRQRSLLFLGSGIRETYLQELFSEILELYGPATRPHYAFIPKGEVDPDFMLARFQIVVVEYKAGDHAEVTRRLDRLADAIEARPELPPANVPVSWSWGRIEAGPGSWRSVPELEIVRGPLPEVPVDGECLAVSAGGEVGKFFYSDKIRELLARWGVKAGTTPDTSISPYLGLYRDKRVYAVRARSEKDLRRLTDVYDASLALFEHAASRYRCIHLQLLGVGGSSATEAPAYERRPFPERFSLVQTVLAWGEWRRRQPAGGCRLMLHVISEPVYADLASGRIDVLELLSCRDVRFWAETVSSTGELERRLFQEMPDTPLRDVLRALNLSANHWTVEVSPATSFDKLDKPAPLAQEYLDEPLRRLGVVPGSTLHFRRPA
ncbi:MAG: SIR2 family NAD-dependent protein deacylase [Myxococcales bacterium]